MSRKATDWAFAQKLPGMQKLVLLAIANRVNEKTGICYPSHELLADDCGIAKRSVITHLENLEKGGFLIVTKEIKNGVKQTNKYKPTYINSAVDALQNTEKDDLVVQEMHEGSAGDALGVVQEMHINQECLTSNLTFSSSLKENENSEPENFTAEQQVVFDFVCEVGQIDPFWKNKITERMNNKGVSVAVAFIYFYQTSAALKNQFAEFQAKKTRASATNTGTGNSFNNGLNQVGGHYETNSNIVQFGNRKPAGKSTSIADRLAEQLAYCKWEEQQQRNSTEQLAN